jgi:hypothetical protein
MSQLSADNETIKGPLVGTGLVNRLPILSGAKLFKGGLLAIDSAGEVQMAADALGLRVLGLCIEQIDNAADGELADPPQGGAYRLENSAAAPVTVGLRGRPCYVEDDHTVASTSTNLVPAGIVVDVDEAGVWVDVSPEALLSARAQARPKVVAVATATLAVTPAQAFQGNVVLACDNAAGVTLTLPDAAPGYRLGVQRIDATAAHDVAITAAAGNTVRGSAEGGTATNDTDAVSQILYLEAESATGWVDAAPLAADRANWAPSA